MRLAGLLALLALLTSCAPPDPRPSVVLVVLDTLRRDFTGIGDNSFTPHLDAFAASATVWTDAYSTAPWTVPSHASMFTGLLPSSHGCTSANPRFNPPSPPLAELLANAGYRTEAFYSNPWLLDDATGLLRGFEEHFVAADPGEDAGDGVDQGGHETLAHLERRLSRGGEPFFFYVNFLESHVPYDPPPSLRGDVEGRVEGRIDSEWILDVQAGLHRPDAEEWARVRALYGGDVRFADRFFGELLDLLEANSFDGMLIVTSDHGESLGENGYVEHQMHLDETLLAVPLAIRAKGLRPGRRGDPVLLTDLYATILEAAGIDAAVPATSLSLLSQRPAADRPLIGEYAGAPPALLRYLHERNPAFDMEEGGRALRSVRIGDRRFAVEEAKPETEAEAPPMSEEVKQRLRDLGYLQ